MYCVAVHVEVDYGGLANLQCVNKLLKDLFLLCRPEYHNRHGDSAVAAVDSSLVGCGRGCRTTETNTERGHFWEYFFLFSLYYT